MTIKRGDIAGLDVPGIAAWAFVEDQRGVCRWCAGVGGSAFHRRLRAIAASAAATATAAALAAPACFAGLTILRRGLRSAGEWWGKVAVRGVNGQWRRLDGMHRLSRWSLCAALLLWLSAARLSVLARLLLGAIASAAATPAASAPTAPPFAILRGFEGRLTHILIELDGVGGHFGDLGLLRFSKV